MVLLFKSFYRFGEITPITQPVDFRAFYCGAKVVSEHHDPYRIHSMTVCENAAADEFRLPHRDILPAPLPPYALYALSPLARLPFAVASPLWAFFIFLARLTQLPTALVLASTILPSLFTSFGVGQFGPLLIVAILGAIFSLRKKNKWASRRVHHVRRTVYVYRSNRNRNSARALSHHSSRATPCNRNSCSDVARRSDTAALVLVEHNRAIYRQYERITANLDRSPIGANPIFHAKLDNPTAIDPIVAGPLRRRPCC